MIRCASTLRPADPDRPRRPKRQRLTADGVLGDACEHLPRARAPEPDHGELLRDVAELDRRVLIAEVEPEPAQVRIDRACAGDDAEARVVEPRHSHVRHDPAPVVEELRVDEAPDRPVDPVVADPLEQGQRARAGDFDLPERGHVDDPDTLAEGLVLHPEPLEPGRLPEPERPLVGSGPPARLPRLEEVRALPPVLRPEDRAEILETSVKRREPLGPAPLVDVERVAEAVVVAVDLARRLLREARIAVRRAEAPGAVAGHVELGLPLADPLGNRLADAAGPAEAVERETGGRPEPRHPGHRPEERIAVRGHRVGMTNERDDARVTQKGEPTDGAVHELLEACVVRRNRHAGVIPRHPVRPARNRVRLVAAEEDPSDLRFAVDEIVEIPEARHLARQLVPVHRGEGNVLVVDRHRGRERPHHRCDLGRPDPAGVDDQLRLDRAGVRLDGGHLARRPEPDPRDAASGLDLDAEVPGGVRESVRRDVGIDRAVALDPDRPVERLARGGGQQPHGLVRREHLDVEPDPAGLAGAALELLEALGARGDAEAPDAVEDAEVPVELDAVPAKAHHRRGGVELGDEAGRVAGRAAGQLALLEEEHVTQPRLREVICDAAPGDPAPYDDDRGTLARHTRPSSLR